MYHYKIFIAIIIKDLFYIIILAYKPCSENHVYDDNDFLNEDKFLCLTLIWIHSVWIKFPVWNRQILATAYMPENIIFILLHTNKYNYFVKTRNLNSQIVFYIFSHTLMCDRQVRIFLKVNSKPA